jgi:hypothetical protein
MVEKMDGKHSALRIPSIEAFHKRLRKGMVGHEI